MPSDVTLRPGRGPYPARFGNLSTDLILSTANSLDEKAPGGISPGGTAIYALLDELARVKDTLIAELMQAHRSEMTSRGRDPANYVSHWSSAADALRDLFELERMKASSRDFTDRGVKDFRTQYIADRFPRAQEKGETRE